MKIKASVCICTYNGAKRLPPVIECLAAQTLVREAWEILIVDNASKDDSAAVAAALLAEHGLTQSRIVLEPTPGQGFARRRAAAEARGDVVCFVDDDNLLAPDFVAEAVRLFDEQPRTGSAGGKVVADWETEPAALVRAVETYALAIVDRGDEAFTYEWVAEAPVGAGMCIRRHLLIDALRDLETAGLVGRCGAGLGSGDDTAIGIKVFQAGFDRRYEPTLRMRHRLPAPRMTREYLLRIYEDSGRSYAPLRRLWSPNGRNRLVALLIAAKNFLLWLRGLAIGPAARMNLAKTAFPPGTEPAALRADLHALEQSLLWGRAAGAWQMALAGRERRSA